MLKFLRPLTKFYNLTVPNRTFLIQKTEVGAQCGSLARRDLFGKPPRRGGYRDRWTWELWKIRL